MADGKFIAYYRVSTDRQGSSGLGLEAQQQAVKNHLNGGDWELIKEVVEIESGKRNNRPELEHALKLCKKHKATLIIAKLDRLSRNLAFIANLMESGVEFIATDMPHANRTMLQIMAVFAEHEREMISKRTKEALRAAKERGVKLGSPYPSKAAVKGREKRTDNADRFASNTHPIIQEIQAAGVNTLNGIANALNARGVRTARGGEWKPMTVKRVMERQFR